MAQQALVLAAHLRQRHVAHIGAAGVGDDVRIIVSRQDWSFISFRSAGSSSTEVTGWVKNRYLIDEEKAALSSIEGQLSGSNIDPKEDAETKQLESAATPEQVVTLPPVNNKKAPSSQAVPIDMSALVDEE